MASGSSQFLDALFEAGVRYLFANLGSDHSGIVEALAEAKAMGKPTPALITCPTEMVALSAAHGFAQVSGMAQAVVVHVECGTQSLAGAVHNAAKGRVPVLIFAGASPFSQHGELKAGRNEFIHWIQDVHDQRGLVRGYTKFDYELHCADQVREVTHRALRFAYSEPQGPVYLMAAREVLEAAANSDMRLPASWRPVMPAALTGEAVEVIATDLLRARRPLIVTSYLGRKPQAVAALVSLCNRFGIAVLESVPSYTNFPHDNPLYQGSQWSEPTHNPVLEEADIVIVIDSDVPWIPLFNRPNSQAIIHHLDVDPLKLQMPLAAVAAGQCYQVDATHALRQIEERLELLDAPRSAIEERHAHYARLHARRRALLDAREPKSSDIITPEYLTACIRESVGADALILSEGISNYPVIVDHLRRTQPTTLFTSGGGSLGWNGGAAIGAKLASPHKTVVALTGDGSYLMSHPCTVHWMARRYRAPFLQVIYNNGGWKSPKLSTLAVHPDGYTSRCEDLGVSLKEPPNYSAIAAAAGGAFAQVVERSGEIVDSLEAALRAVRIEGRAAVLDVRLPVF
jgi:acetolactate synthase-1/2/3 large subunit